MRPCCLQCYLSTLELVKSATMGVAGRLAANEAQQAGMANFVAGVQPGSTGSAPTRGQAPWPQPETAAPQPLPLLRPLPCTCSNSVGLRFPCCSCAATIGHCGS